MLYGKRKRASARGSDPIEKHNRSGAGKLLELERVLLTEVPPERFCCDGINQDKRMCIQPGDNGQWIVFFREGTLGEDVTVHPDFEEAALQLIKNVAPSDAALERMRARFHGGK